MSDKNTKSQVKVELDHIQADLKQQLKATQVKIDAELERIMGPQLKKCIDKAAKDQVKVNECYKQLQKRVQPILDKLKKEAAQSNTALQKCLESKQNAKICAKTGIQSSQKYLNSALNDLKSYLS